MTRLELLTLVVGRARSNGFEFRRWYTSRLSLPWITSEAALALLDQQRRYYALLFSHDFACAFWKAGEEITFTVPAQTFERAKPDGSVVTIRRKSFTRRSARRDAWRYHLREMALAEEPLRYLRRYLHVEDEFTDAVEDAVPESSKRSTRSSVVPPMRKRGRPKTPPANAKTAKPFSRPMPSEPPAFLSRPYP